MFGRSNTSFKAAFYGLLLIISYLLLTLPPIALKFMGVTPELLLVLTVCVAFNESKTFSAIFGLAAGILKDTITESIVGKSAIFFMFAAFFISVLTKTLFRRFFLTYIFIELCTLLLFLATEYLLVALFYGGVGFLDALWQVILPKFLFSGVLAYPVFYVVRFLNNKLCGGDVR